MSELASRIAEICERNGLAKEAFVVDDEWDQRDSLDAVAWDEFVQAVSQDTRVFAALTSSLADQGYELTMVPPPEVLEEALSRFGDLPKEVLEAKARLLSTPHVLKRLELILKELDFQIHDFATKPDLKQYGLPSLLIMDYHVEPEGPGGGIAKRTFREVMEFCQHQGSVPPFVILMSQRLPIDSADTVAEVAAESGFFRFRYDFLHKVMLRQSPDAFHLTLLSLLRQLEASKAYFSQLRKLESECARLGTEAARRLMQVTPAEVLLFKSRMHQEGLDLGRALTDLFRELLSQRLAASSEILKAMNALEAALASGGVPAVEMQEGGPLHRLYAEMITQPVDYDDGNPPQFGDIYREHSGRLFMVISQECDLASGLGRKPKAKDVLMLEAELSDQPASGKGTQICKPVFFKEDKKSKWLCWSPLRMKLVPYEALQSAYCAEDIVEEPFGLSGKPYVKVFHLRAVDAEHVQQFFASQLTRVGVDPLPAIVQQFTAEIRDMDTGTVRQAELYAIADEEGLLVALRPGSLSAFLGSGGDDFLPSEVLSEMVIFTPLSRLVATLKENGVFLGNDSGRAVFVRPMNKKPREMKEWKGPK